MPTNQPRVTIRDVAARAGVSHQTVSRVINGSERVNPDTRARVEAAISELGFRPSAIARSMAEGRTRTLACISPNLTDYTFASIIEGATDEARRQGYFIISASAPDEASFTQLVEQLIDSRRTEGLLVINPYADQRHALLPQDVPTVYVGARPRTEIVNAVSLDDVAGGEAVANHLLSMGHRQIALITGPLVEDCSQDRMAGFCSVLEADKLSIDPELNIAGDWSATSGYETAMKLVKTGKPFTAVFAQNDRMAVGAIRGLREAGKRIPEDVSVVGFDDMPLASYFDPPLTTMRQDIFKIGSEAAGLLIRAVEEPGSPHRQIRLPAELVIRRSTAKVN